MIVLKRMFVASLFAALLLPLRAGLAQSSGALIVVNSTADAIADDGQCTLREAIIAANTNSPSGDSFGAGCTEGSSTQTDTIVLPLDVTISLTIAGSGENASATGDLDIVDNAAAVDLILVTPSSTGTPSTISQDASPDDRVVDIHYGAVVEITFVRITGGSVADDPYSNDIAGGGILNQGTLTLNYSRVSGNYAPAGGGIASGQLNGLTVRGSLITQNSTASYGGGINMHSGTITETEIFGNSAQYGGGISTGFMSTLDYTTVMSNTATAKGGGIYNGGTLTIRNRSLISNNFAQNGGGVGGGGATHFDASTLSNNTASSSGGGMNHQNGTATFRNGSVVSNNTAQQAGGGIYHANSSVTLNASRLQGNSALIGGGIFHLSWGSTTITDSILALNRNISGSVSGSAVHVYDGVGANAVNITGSCITGNSYIAVNSSSANSQNASGNWWGSPGGPNSSGGDTTGGNWNTSGFLTAPAAACNLIANSTMQADATGDNLPDAFIYSGLTAQDGRACPVASDCVLRLVGNGSPKTAYQTVSQSGWAGDRYTLWLDHDANKISGGGVMRVEVLFYQGGTQTGQHTLNLNGGTHGWQQLSLPITAAGSYDRIVVVLTYQKNKGTLQVDDLSLVREP